MENLADSFFPLIEVADSVSLHVSSKDVELLLLLLNYVELCYINQFALCTTEADSVY